MAARHHGRTRGSSHGLTGDDRPPWPPGTMAEPGEVLTALLGTTDHHGHQAPWPNQGKSSRPYWGRQATMATRHHGRTRGSSHGLTGDDRPPWPPGTMAEPGEVLTALLRTTGHHGHQAPWPNQGKSSRPYWGRQATMATRHHGRTRGSSHGLTGDDRPPWPPGTMAEPGEVLTALLRTTGHHGHQAPWPNQGKFSRPYWGRQTTMATRHHGRTRGSPHGLTEDDRPPWPPGTMAEPGEVLGALLGTTGHHGHQAPWPNQGKSSRPYWGRQTTMATRHHGRTRGSPHGLTGDDRPPWPNQGKSSRPYWGLQSVGVGGFWCWQYILYQLILIRNSGTLSYRDSLAFHYRDSLTFWAKIPILDTSSVVISLSVRFPLQMALQKQQKT